MAIDEALLELAILPTLRFYGWAQPALSFGYFGRFAEAVHEVEKRDVIRRWTGGGIVLHGSDVTYSLVLPRATLGRSTSPRHVYSFVHSAIQRVLRYKAEVTLAATDAAKVSDACFANPVVADLLANGRKIAGAAQRRTRAGLLHQGSIQYEQMPALFAPAMAAELCGNFAEHEITGVILGRADELASAKYGTSAWLRQR